VPGGGGVEDQQVGHAVALHLLDLAEHEDVADAGDGGGHHVEGARADEALGDAAHAAPLEELHEGFVGGEGAGPDLGGAGVGVGVGEGDLVVGEVGLVVHGGQPDLPSTSTISDAQAAACGRERDGRRYRGFADTALARNDDEARSREERCWIHFPHRRLHLEARALRRLPILGAALATLGVILGAFDVASTPAAAQEACRWPGLGHQGGGPHRPGDGRLHQPVHQSRASDAGVVAVVLQMNSPDAVVSDARSVDLARQIHEADVPVTCGSGRRDRALGAARPAGWRRRRVGIAPGLAPGQDRRPGGPRGAAV
jgi:hypothetical protein